MDAYGAAGGSHDGVVLLAAFLIFQYSNYEEQKNNQQLKESILNEQ